MGAQYYSIGRLRQTANARFQLLSISPTTCRLETLVDPLLGCLHKRLETRLHVTPSTTVSTARPARYRPPFCISHPQTAPLQPHSSSLPHPVCRSGAFGTHSIDQGAVLGCFLITESRGPLPFFCEGRYCSSPLTLAHSLLYSIVSFSTAVTEPAQIFILFSLPNLDPFSLTSTGLCGTSRGAYTLSILDPHHRARHQLPTAGLPSLFYTLFKDSSIIYHRTPCSASCVTGIAFCPVESHLEVDRSLLHLSFPLISATSPTQVDHHCIGPRGLWSPASDQVLATHPV